MRPTNRLKDQARLLEQKEEWEQAAQLYLQVLRVSEEDGDTSIELGLYNRIGDLYLKLGRATDAVAFYEQAADHYASEGLYNNAIALCNKALRHLPERASLYLKLGRLSAEQGFVTDARRWFVEFAERQIRRGGLDEAFNALRELADRIDDAEVRELLARQLHAHGRTDQAVIELRRAYASRWRAGELEVAEALREEIRGLDPRALDTLADELEPAPAVEEDGNALPLLPELGLESAAEAAGLQPAAPEPAAPEPAADGRSASLPPDTAQAQPVADRAPAAAPAPRVGAAPPAGPPEPAEAGDEADELAGELPLLEPEEPVAPAARVERPPAAAEPPAALEPTEDERAAVPEALPLLESEEDELALARALFRRGRAESGREMLERLATEAEAAGDLGRAARALAVMAEMAPDDLALHRRLVEASFRAAGTRGGVDALLGLAAALERAGLAAKASVAYQQVLDIDPSNAVAGAALKRERAARPRPADEGDYIDLGALLLDDSEPESTRYVVEAAPTGDEERDFVEMLEQFKDKVAAHMGEDPQAHYDLGLAYKEMGLLDEAVAEFQVALRGGQDRLKVLEELGRCFLLKGQPNIALKVLQQALDLPQASEMERMGVYYLMGRCHEDLGNAQAARDAYERVVGLDVQFDDVAQRLARL